MANDFESSHQDSSNDIYFLSGASKEAAIILKHYIAQFDKDRAQKSRTPPRSAHISPRDYVRSSKALMQYLKQNASESLKALGYTSPAIQVETLEGGAPRAYEFLPTLHYYRKPQGFLDLSGADYDSDDEDYDDEDYGDDSDIVDSIPYEMEEGFYLFCPIDYNGHSFSPLGARRLILDHAYAIESHLADAEAIDGTVALLDLPQTGVPLPTDYVSEIAFPPPRKENDKDDKKDNTSLIAFKAEGRSLTDLISYGKLKEAYERHVNEIQHFISSRISQCLTDNCPDPTSDIYTEVYILRGKHGQPFIQISLQTATTYDPYDTAIPVMLKDNDLFAVTKQLGIYYHIAPNTDTPQGRDLDRLLKTIPFHPEMGTFPHLLISPAVAAAYNKLHFNVAARDYTQSPEQFWDFGAEEEKNYYLLYRVPRNLETIYSRPSDALPMSSKALLWVKCDQHDKDYHIKPPPMPTDIQNELKNLRLLSKHLRKSGPRRPPPSP